MSRCPIWGELYFVPGRSSDIIFVNAIRTHGAPFVMVTFEPNFGHGAEHRVFRDLTRGEVTVVIKNQHGRSIVMIKSARGFTM